MSVILSLNDWQYRSAQECCTICGEYLVPPFVLWRGTDTLYFCEECCARDKRGLMADMIQVAAISELQALGSHFGGTTLQRKSVQEVREEDATKQSPVEPLPETLPDFGDQIAHIFGGPPKKAS